MITEEQRKARLNSIGASEAAAAIGINPYRTQFDLWLEKTGQTDPFEGNERTMWGQILEEPVLRHLSDQVGLPIRRNSITYTSKEHPYMTATPDGKVVGQPIGVEIKTGGFFTRNDWGESGTDEIPDQYMIQVMHQMIVCGFDAVVIGVLLGGQEFQHYHIDRDDELCREITIREGDFWRHVTDRRPPPAVNLADIAQLYPHDNGKSIRASDDIVAVLNKLQATKQETAQIKARSDQLELTLKAYLGDNTTLIDSDGEVLATWKSQMSNRLDTTRLRTEQPEIAAQFTKQIGSRVLRLRG